MPLPIKTFKDFVNSVIGKFIKELPEVDPTIDASLAKTMSISSAISASNLQEGVQGVVNQAFWQTADGDFLAKKGEYNKVFQNQPQSALGNACVEGVIDTIITAGTNLTGSNGVTYQVLQDASVQEYVGSCALNYSAGIVTVTTDAVHNLATGLNITISDATQTAYNGTFLITVIDENTFQYDLLAGALTSDLGNFSGTYAEMSLQALSTGQNTNISAGGTLSIDVTDIEETAYASYDGITGGTDEESDDDYRVRVGEANSTTPGIATPSAEIFSAKKIAGNTRVFVVRGQENSSGIPGDSGYIPSLGQTVIYVVRDDDVSIIPSQSILDATKQQILDDGNWPTLTPEENLFVLAPILVEQDFTISNLTPNTITMQNAITERLVDFFRDYAQVGNPTYTIQFDDLKTFLRSVVDSTGARVETITIDNPNLDIVAQSGEIYTRGTVTFV